MNLEDAKVFVSDAELKVGLPLTKPTSKIRIKERSFFSDYGLPVAGRTQNLGLRNYLPPSSKFFSCFLVYLTI